MVWLGPVRPGWPVGRPFGRLIGEFLCWFVGRLVFVVRPCCASLCVVGFVVFV